MDRLVDEAGVEAILCLQSDECMKELEIPIEDIRGRATDRGVVHCRLAMVDFDRIDQAVQLPAAVSCLWALLRSGKRTYVHCTAGMNRATLVAVGYLTFVQGWQVEAAVSHVKSRRSVADPYVDCWEAARCRLLEGRGGTADGGDAAAEAAAAAEARLIRDVLDRTSQSYHTMVQSMVDLASRKKA